MNKSTPFRFFFHEAPRYDENGDLLYPEAVMVARRVSEVPLGLRWIRRRLGLRAYGPLIEGCRFLDEILPLPDPVNPLALSTTPATAKLTSTTPASNQPAMTATTTIDQPVITTKPPAPLLDLPSPAVMTTSEESVPALSVAELNRLPAAKPVEKITFATEDLLLSIPAKPHVIDLDSLSATVAAEIKSEIPAPTPDLENPSSLEAEAGPAILPDDPLSLASTDLPLVSAEPPLAAFVLEPPATDTDDPA